MGVYDFAGSLCSAVVSVLPYVVIYRLVDILFMSLQRGIFEGKLSFRGSKV